MYWLLVDHWSTPLANPPQKHRNPQIGHPQHSQLKNRDKHNNQRGRSVNHNRIDNLHTTLERGRRPAPEVFDLINRANSTSDILATGTLPSA